MSSMIGWAAHELSLAPNPVQSRPAPPPGPLRGLMLVSMPGLWGVILVSLNIF
jgi:hypothetical protein